MKISTNCRPQTTVIWKKIGIILASSACTIHLSAIHVIDVNAQESRRQLPPSLPTLSSPSSSRSTLGDLPSQLPGAPATQDRSPATLPASLPTTSILTSPTAQSLENTPTQPTIQPSDTQMPRPSGNLNRTINSQLVSTNRAKLAYCPVKIIEKIQLPASEIGPLAEVLVRDGQTISKGMVIAKVDDRQAITELNLSESRLATSALKVDTDIAIRYAQAGYDAAYKTYERELSLYKKNVGTAAKLDEARLQAQQALLQIEKAKHDYSVDQKAVRIEEIQVQKAKETLQRHSTIAPWGGIVNQVLTHQGEWVNAGDPIVEIIQMDRLWVEGDIDARQINPFQVTNRPVEVILTLAQGEKVKFQGKVVYVELEVTGDSYKIRAEVQNRTHMDHWLLIPGMDVEMEIDLMPNGGVERLSNQPGPLNHQQSSLLRRDFGTDTNLRTMARLAMK